MSTSISKPKSVAQFIGEIIIVIIKRPLCHTWPCKTFDNIHSRVCTKLPPATPVPSNSTISAIMNKEVDREALIQIHHKL